MPKIKVPRKSISLDMTAMCDMAFLLLTFFILTAKMKPAEPTKADVPSAVSMRESSKDILKIIVGDDNRVFIGLTEQPVRRKLVEVVYNETYGLNLNQEQLYKVSLLEYIGLPSTQVQQYLALPEEEIPSFKPSGIPVDSVNNELKVWLRATRYNYQDLKIAIKADKTTEYNKTVNKVVNTLVAINENHVNFITSLEAAPQE